MRSESCKPALAKGAVLARPLKLPRRRLGAGTIIGNAEIEQLLGARVAAIDVIWMGLGDLIAHAAATMVARALIGGQLDNLPGRGDSCELAATTAGLLVYDEARLAAAAAAHPSFSVTAAAPTAPLMRHQACVKVSCAVPVAARARALEAAAAMPPLFVRPYLPLKLALLAPRASRAGLGVIARQLKLYGSAWPEPSALPADAAALDAALAALAACDAVLALCPAADELAALRRLLGARGELVALRLARGASSWFAANVGRTTVVALRPAGNAAALRRLLGLLHAGVALKEGSLAGASR